MFGGVLAGLAFALAPQGEVSPSADSPVLAPLHVSVIDGDTFRYRGEKIRLADIDAPETHRARCAYEAELGARATRRLEQLLRQGSFTLDPADRDEDRYGRKLRIAMREGNSIGDQLVREGLARPWTGRRQPWC